MKDTKKAAAPTKVTSGLPNHNADRLAPSRPEYNTPAEQRALLLTALRRGPVTNEMARNQLGINDLRRAVDELRAEGHNLCTKITCSASGYRHVVFLQGWGRPAAGGKP